jgi:hypothetical protein
MSPVPNANELSGVNGTSSGISAGPHQSTHKRDLAQNPLQRVWRGNKEGTVTMAGVPRFDNSYDEREWIKVNDSFVPYNERLTQRHCPGAHGGRLPLLGKARFW